jgi:uncharacterized membrane protein
MFTSEEEEMIEANRRVAKAYGWGAMWGFIGGMFVMLAIGVLVGAYV